LTSENAGLLRFVNEWRVGLVWPSEANLRRDRGPLQAANWASHKDTISQAASMHAMFAYAWSWKGRLDPRRASFYQQRATEHTIQGVQALQRLITSVPPPALLLPALEATVYFQCVEMHRGSLANVLAHASASKRILDIMGGLKTLPWVYQETVINVFSHLAGNVRMRPSIHPREWDPGPLDRQAWKNNYPQAIDNMTTSLGASLEADEPISVLEGILRDIRELVAVEEVKLAQASTESEDVDQIYRWTYRRRYAIRAYALQHWCDLTEPTNAVGPTTVPSPSVTTVYHSSLEISLCCAIRLFELGIVEVCGLKVGAWVRHIHAVQGMLLGCLLALDRDIEDMDTTDQAAPDMLWIYSVGAAVEEEYIRYADKAALEPFGLDKHPRWFSLRFAVAARRLGFEDFEQVIALFKRRYVYSTRTQDKNMRRVFAFKW
jgi:hypothetical protein